MQYVIFYIKFNIHVQNIFGTFKFYTVKFEFTDKLYDAFLCHIDDMFEFEFIDATVFGEEIDVIVLAKYATWSEAFALKRLSVSLNLWKLVLIDFLVGRNQKHSMQFVDKSFHQSQAWLFKIYNR